MIATPRNADARQNPGSMANFAQRVPLGAHGEPADITGSAMFLTSDLARYATSVTVPVNSGFLAN